MAIRLARESDLDAIEALERAVFTGDRLSRRSLKTFIAARRGLLVAIEADHLIGYGLVIARKGARIARLYSIAVDPRAAARGVGRALLAACERHAVQEGRHALRLEVRADNHRAISLYERLGYQRFGRHESYYADGEAALRFQKRLSMA